MKRLWVLLLALAPLAGCQGSPPPPPPPKVAMPSPSAPTAVTDPKRQQEDLAKLTAYTKEKPWGENTGSGSLRGTMTWAEGGAPPAPLARRPLMLKSLTGEPTEKVRYLVRTGDQGEFQFDRIRGGDYKLSDDSAAGFHWRLRVTIGEGQDLTLNLGPDNSVKVRDDFPQDGN